MAVKPYTCYSDVVYLSEVQNDVLAFRQVGAVEMLCVHHFARVIFYAFFLILSPTSQRIKPHRLSRSSPLRIKLQIPCPGYRKQGLISRIVLRTFPLAVFSY